MTYPESFEQWWENETLRRLKLVKRNVCIHKLVIATDILSDTFTSQREEDFSGYSQDEEAVLAYGCYFFPQTHMRARFALRELMNFRKWRPSSQDRIRILDVGCGLGAASTGAVSELNTQGITNGMLIDALDQSNLQLELLRSFTADHRELWPNARWMTHHADMKNALQQSKFANAEGWDLIIVSFSLGEAFFDKNDEQVASWIFKLLDKLKTGGICLILEPALAETSLRLQRVRDFLLKNDEAPYIQGPCLQAQKCPMLQRHGNKHWCHEVRRWKVPSFINEINQRLDSPRNVQELKYSFLALSNTSSSQFDQSDGLFRMTSPVVETSGKFQMSGCAASGRLNDYDLLTRGFKAKDKKEVRKLERGDIIHASDDMIVHLKGEHQVRLKSKKALNRIYKP